MAATTDSTAALPDITPEAFFAANEAGEKWTVIEGTVYDISKWFDRHPGGRRMLSLAVGTDATANFYCYHPPSVDRLLGSAKVPAVGKFTGKLPTATKMTDFFKNMRTECWAKLQSIPGFTKQGTKMQAHYKANFVYKYASRFAFMLVAAYFQSWILGIVAAYQLAMTGYKGQCALLAHGASHFYVNSNNFVNTLCLHFFIPLGTRATEFFTAEHHMHHAFTRVKGLDQQISVDFPHWMVRLSSFTDSTTLTRNQRKTAAVLLFFKLFVVDTLYDSFATVYGLVFTDFAAGFSQFMRMAPPQPRFTSKSKLEGTDLLIGRYTSTYGATVLEGTAYVATYIASIALSPNCVYFWMLAFGPAMGLALLAVHNLCYWYRVFMSTADGSVDPVSMSMHLNSRMESPSLGLYGHSDMITVEEHQAHDWGLQQSINSGNLYGVPPEQELGAAWQIEHHLFPNLSGEWYPYITPIIKRMLEDYTMPDGKKLDYSSLWYTVERECEVAHKLYAEYANDVAGSRKMLQAKEVNAMGLARDLGLE